MTVNVCDEVTCQMLINAKACSFLFKQFYTFIINNWQQTNTTCFIVVIFTYFYIPTCNIAITISQTKGIPIKTMCFALNNERWTIVNRKFENGKLFN